MPDADDTFRTLRAWLFQAGFGSLLAEHPDEFKQSLADNIRAGEHLTGADVARAYAQRTALSDRMREFFTSYDVLVLPVSQVPPFPADQEFPTEINGRPMETYLDWMRACYLITVTGCPAISVPFGHTAGRPSGRAPDRRAARRGPVPARGGGSGRGRSGDVTGHDLVVADATLRGRDGRWRIGIDGDRISTVTPTRSPAARRSTRPVPWSRRASSTATCTSTRCTPSTGSVTPRSRRTPPVTWRPRSPRSSSPPRSRRTTTGRWIEPNARRAVVEAVRHGVRHVLAFADVDTKARLEGVIPLLALREEFRGVVDLQVVAFPQDGLLRDPGAEDLVREAVDLGADVVGGIPWIEHTDAEAREHVRRMCALAAAHGRRVAMLVDDAGDAVAADHRDAREALLEHGLVGRGVANHARALGLYPRPTLERLAGPGPPGWARLRLRPAHRARCTCRSAS